MPKGESEFFAEITRIPRPSGHLGVIQAYLERNAAELCAECARDDFGNIPISRRGTSGRTVYCRRTRIWCPR